MSDQTRISEHLLARSSIPFDVSDFTQFWIGWVFYNSAKQMIGSRTVVTAFKGKITVPSNAAYIRISSRYLKKGYLEIS